MNKEAFKIDVQELDACRKEVKVEVPKKEIKAAFESTLNNIKNRVNLPGFRAGKAPKALLLKKYAKDVEEQVKQDVFRAVMESIFDDESTTPVSQPEIEQGDIKQSEDYLFSMKFDVSPEIELPAYKAYELAAAKVEIDTDEVEKQLAEVAERFAKLEIVERAAAEDDFTKCDYDGKIDIEEGAEIPEAAQGVLSGEGRWVPIKEQSLIPGAMAGLKGKKAGEKVEWTAKFEDEYPVEFLKGKEVTYSCTVVEVHGRVTPELNDELAKEAGAEDLADLKKKIEDGQENQKKAEVLNTNKEIILEKILDGFECTLPPTLLKAEIARTLHSMKHEKGVDHDCDEPDHEHDDSCGHNEEDVNAGEALKKEAEEKAIKELKTRFLVRKIAKVEEVKVEDFEVEYQVYMMAQQYNVDPAVFKEQLERNGSLEEFREQILVDKTLAKIVELNTQSED